MSKASSHNCVLMSSS